MPRAALTFALLGALAAPAAAQAPKSIDPGMTQAQVVERLGEPNALRTAGAFTYLFYKNGCVRECGMDDLVLLENDAVVDAIFRSPERGYTGKSSSPRAIPAEVAVRGRSTREATSPGPEVTQQGAPREAAAPAPTDAPKPAADTAQPAPEPKKPAAAPKKEERPEVDSAKSAAQPAQPAAAPASNGTLRIPIKTKPRPAKDSTQSGAAGTKSPT